MRPLAAIVAVLREEPTITTLAEDWVFYPELPRQVRVGTNEVLVAQEMPRYAVVVQGAGGASLGPGARSYVPWKVVRVQVKSYGQIPEYAEDLDAVVYDFMTSFHGKVHKESKTLLRDAVVSGGPINLRDPDTDWPYMLSVYDLSASPNS